MPRSMFLLVVAVLALPAIVFAETLATYNLDYNQVDGAAGATLSGFVVFDLDLIRNDNGHPDTLDFLIDFEVVLVDNAGSVTTFALTDLTEFILETVGGVDLTTGDFDISDLEDLSFEADSDVMFDDQFVVSIEGPGLKFELVAVTRDTDDGGTIMGDPHFFVGSSLYDWKQVGVYDHLVFDDHAVTLGVEEFNGCNGQVAGEFIRGLFVGASSYKATCDGIYNMVTGDLASAVGLRISTHCVAFDLVLTNGYLNLHNIALSCEVKGGVYKTLTDHAAANVDGWWEWTQAGGFELKDTAVPKVVPLVAKPRVIVIDL